MTTFLDRFKSDNVTPMTNYRIKVVDTLDGFKELKDTWDSLVEKNCSYLPWQNWDWFNLWLKYFSDRIQLLILTVYKGDGIVAIAPFMVVLEKYKGMMKIKKLELIGNVRSTVRDILLGVPEDSEKILLLETIFQFFAREYKDWDIIELERVPEQGDSFNNIRKAVTAIGLKHRTYTSDANWYLDNINYTSTEYFNNQPYAFSKQMLNQMKRFKKISDWKIEIKSHSDLLDNDLDSYDKLRAKSWKAEERDRAFNNELTQLFAKKGWLRFAFLYSGNGPVAAQKWVVCNRTAYIWDLIYDQEYKKFSPGSILSSELCRYVIDEDKIVELDYMTGDEPYKKFWTPLKRERMGITIFNNTPKGKALGFLVIKVLPFIQSQPSLRAAKNKVLKYLGKGHQ